MSLTIKQTENLSDVIQNLEAQNRAKDQLATHADKELAMTRLLVQTHERKAQEALLLAEEAAVKIDKNSTKFNDVGFCSFFKILVF